MSHRTKMAKWLNDISVIIEATEIKLVTIVVSDPLTGPFAALIGSHGNDYF